jgi:hypothetical protein
MVDVARYKECRRRGGLRLSLESFDIIVGACIVQRLRSGALVVIVVAIVIVVVVVVVVIVIIVMRCMAGFLVKILGGSLSL